MKRLFVGVMLVALAAGPAHAWTGTVTWPSFLYQGPATRYAVLDELTRGQRVEVQSCGDAWCRITLNGAAGYLDKTAITPASQAQTPTQSIQDLCFDARSDGYGKGEV